MTQTVVWALLAVIVLLGIAVGYGRFVTVKARLRDASSEVGPSEARAVSGSAYEVALTCRVDGHAYAPYDTGWRCATCGNHVARREGELYGPVEEGRHERRRRAR